MSRFKPVDPDSEARVRSSFEKQGFMKTIGAVMTRVAPGEVVIEFPYDASLTQQQGYIHGGVVTAVVDTACGYAAYTLMPPDSEVLTVEYKVNFMLPARGERFRGIGKVLKSGRTITVCSGEVVAVEEGKEKVAAAMLATMISVARQ